MKWTLFFKSLRDAAARQKSECRALCLRHCPPHAEEVSHSRSSMIWPLHFPRLTSNPSQPHQYQIIHNSPHTHHARTCLWSSVYAIPLPGWPWPSSHPFIDHRPSHDQLLVVPSHSAHISHFPTLLLSPTSKDQVMALDWTPTALVKPLYLGMYHIPLKLSTPVPLSDLKCLKSRNCIFFTSEPQPHCTKHSVNVYWTDPNWKEYMHFCDT